MTAHDGSFDAWLEKGRNLYHLGHHGGAIDALKRALALEPTDAEAHALLALALLGNRRLAAAEREAAEALALAPELPTALFAHASVALSRRAWEEAERACETLLTLAPGEVAYLRLMAELRRRLDLDAAEALLEQARPIDPDDPHTLCELGEVALQRNDRARAGELALRALAHAPELTRAHVLAGRVALERGEVAEARDHARSALRQSPQDPTALHPLTAIKAHESPVLGLWWRFQVLLGDSSSRRSLAVLLGLFLVVRLLVILAEGLELFALAKALELVWMGFCAYTWYAPSLFRRMLERELEEVELSPDY